VGFPTSFYCTITLYRADTEKKGKAKTDNAGFPSNTSQKQKILCASDAKSGVLVPCNGGTQRDITNTSQPPRSPPGSTDWPALCVAPDARHPRDGGGTGFELLGPGGEGEGGLLHCSGVNHRTREPGQSSRKASGDPPPYRKPVALPGGKKKKNGRPRRQRGVAS